jgi:hypothetical protein
MRRAAHHGGRKKIAKKQAGTVARPIYMIRQEVKHDSC